MSQDRDAIIRQVKEAGNITGEQVQMLREEEALSRIKQAMELLVKKPRRWTELINIWRCECGETIAHFDTLSEDHPEPVLRGQRRLNLRLHNIYASEENGLYETRGHCRKCNIRHDIPLMTQVRSNGTKGWPELMRFRDQTGKNQTVTVEQMVERQREKYREQKKKGD